MAHVVTLGFRLRRFHNCASLRPLSPSDSLPAISCTMPWYILDDSRPIPSHERCRDPPYKWRGVGVPLGTKICTNTIPSLVPKRCWDNAIHTRGCRWLPWLEHALEHSAVVDQRRRVQWPCKLVAWRSRARSLQGILSPCAWRRKRWDDEITVRTTMYAPNSGSFATKTFWNATLASW